MVGCANGSTNGTASHIHGMIVGMRTRAGSPMDFSCMDDSHNTPEIGRNRLVSPRPRKMRPIQIASGPMSCAIIISGAYKMRPGIMEYRMENHCCASADIPKQVIIYPT